MKAAVLHAKKDLRVEQIEKPIINEGEVLIRVRATGICGSDIPRVLGDGAHFFPNILGHEFCGVVEEVGENVSNVQVGDIVSAAPLKPCHSCEDCLKGNYSQCKRYSFIGSREFGAWAEYVKVPGQNVVKLPSNISYIQGAFIEPTTVALHALKVMDFKPLTCVAITGMGTIGLLALQCAKIMGAKEITVLDVDDKKLEIAKQLGATYTINSLDSELSEKVKLATDGRGYEMVIEAAGVPSAALTCLEIAANKASVMFVGTPHKEFTITPKQFEYMNRKELTLRGSWMSYSSPYPGAEWELAGYYLANGMIKTEQLLDRVISLDEIGIAFEAIESKEVQGKVMLEV